MTILELYTVLLPLIHFLGTICLIGLLAGGILFTIAWIIKKVWKCVLAVSTVSLALFAAILIMGAM